MGSNPSYLLKSFLLYQWLCSDFPDQFILPKMDFKCLHFSITESFKPLYYSKIGPIFVSSAFLQLKKNIKICFIPGHFVVKISLNLNPHIDNAKPKSCQYEYSALYAKLNRGHYNEFPLQ